ncbi:hypothetical protein L7F22_024296 [Adiantum nelumboides]|nr:hypothetical protein [Adiantum nelumboides]
MASQQTHRLLQPSVKIDVDFLTIEEENTQQENSLMHKTRNETGMEVEGPTYTVQMTSNKESLDHEEEAAKEAMSERSIEPLVVSQKRCIGFSSLGSKSSNKDVPQLQSKASSIDFLEATINETLFDFVYKVGAFGFFHLASKVFNTPLPTTESLLEQHLDYLTEERSNFERAACHVGVVARGKAVIHLQDCAPSKKSRSTLYRKYAKLPSHMKPFWCVRHGKECELIFDPCGFLIYIHCL